MIRRLIVATSVGASLVLVGCGSSSSNNSSASGPRQVANIPVENIAAGSTFSFDISTTLGGKYYFTDRNNKSVDVVDIASNTFLGSIQGSGANAFTGCLPVSGTSVCAGANNGLSGPDGLNAVSATVLYAGDVNSVKVIDTANKVGGPFGTIVTTLAGVGLAPGNSGNRADEGCVDSTHHQFWISSPEDVPPTATIVDITNPLAPAIAARITFTDAAAAPSAGLENCQYDAANDLWFVNNDGTTAFPHGELDVIPGASVRGIAAGTQVNYTTLTGLKTYDEGNCDPTGLALGPSTDIAVGCRPGTTGAPLVTKIFNRLTGALVATVPFGGGDQVEYDPTTNRYYNAGSRWTASGNAATNGTCATASPCIPSLGIIDGTSHAVVAILPTGNNAHSVGVDSITGKIFLPYSSAAAPGGCPGCTTNFANGGISVFMAQ